MDFLKNAANFLDTLAQDAKLGVLPEEHYDIPEWAEIEEEYNDEEESEETEKKKVKKEDPKLFGSCILEIHFNNKYEYEKWLKYHPDRKWDFIVTYPAVMRAIYDFHTALEVEIMAKKIVQLLQMGFNVYSARWQLKEYQSQLGNE